MSGHAENPARVLNLHVKDSDARQSVTERRPVRSAISREINADVGAGEEIVRVKRINCESVNWNVRKHITSGSVHSCQSWCRAQISYSPNVGLRGCRASGVAAKRNISSVLVCRIEDYSGYIKVWDDAASSKGIKNTLRGRSGGGI